MAVQWYRGGHGYLCSHPSAEYMWQLRGYHRIILYSLSQEGIFGKRMSQAFKSTILEWALFAPSFAPAAVKTGVIPWPRHRMKFNVCRVHWLKLEQWKRLYRRNAGKSNLSREVVYVAAGCRGGWRTVMGLVANPVPACLKDKLPDNIIVCTTRGAGIKSLSGRDLDGGIFSARRTRPWFATWSPQK